MKYKITLELIFGNEKYCIYAESGYGMMTRWDFIKAFNSLSEAESLVAKLVAKGHVYPQTIKIIEG